MEKYIVDRYIVSDNDDIYQILIELINNQLYASYIFEFGLIRDFEKLQKKCTGLNLKKYLFECDINMDGEYKEKFISNLGKQWKYANPSACGELCKDEFLSIMQYCKQKRFDCLTVMFGLDGVKWGGNIGDVCERGTYGFDKAKSYFERGFNYLSNSIIVSKTNTDKKTVIHVSRKETEGNNYFYLNKIKEKMGQPKVTYVFYAPSDERERMLWNKKNKEAKSRYEDMLVRLEKKKMRVPNVIKDAPSDTTIINSINVKQLVKEIIASTKWEIVTKKDLFTVGVSIQRTKGESTIRIHFDAIDKGHYLQTIVIYSSIYYFFSNNINYIYFLKDEEDVKRYLDNALFLGDFIFDSL